MSKPGLIERFIAWVASFIRGPAEYSTKAPGPTWVDPEVFRTFGYLQEVNRQFLHPLGLALEIVEQDGRAVSFGGVWDYRHDPEGIVFDPADIDPEKTSRVQAEFAERSVSRRRALGYVVQPVHEINGEPGEES